jgi:hypothetical protein
MKPNQKIKAKPNSKTETKNQKPKTKKKKNSYTTRVLSRKVVAGTNLAHSLGSALEAGDVDGQFLHRTARAWT